MQFDIWLKERLLSELPGYDAQVKMTRYLKRPKVMEAPSDARQSAVLLLMNFDNDTPSVLLIKRTEYNGAHSGQMAFPGGKWEDGDSTLYLTALREANEEIMMQEKDIRYIGSLTPLYVPVSNFLIHPFLVSDSTFNYPNFSHYEVQSVHYYSLEEVYSSQKDVELNLPYYAAKIKTTAYVPKDGNVIWGATAMILSELEELFQEYKILNKI